MEKNLSAPEKYIPQLDGVRGLAILLVLTFHYFGFLKVFSFGWIGVDLFFVLSGYLITSRLYVTRKEENYFFKFYRNRALRILPLYYLTLIVFYAGFNLLVHPQNLYAFNFYNKNWWSFLLFFENWSFINEQSAAKHLQHFWSLAVEEQFYLIWPLFLFIFLDKKYFYSLLLLILTAIIILRSYTYMRHPLEKDVATFFYNTFYRMDGFIIGGCLFLFQHRIKIKVVRYYFLLSLFILITGVYFTNTKQSNPFISTIGYTVVALFFAALIRYCTIKRQSFLGRLSNTRWLKFAGKISYGLYVYHWLILITLQPKISIWIGSLFDIKEEVIVWLSLIVCLIITVIISIISYFYFESYFLRLKKK